MVPWTPILAMVPPSSDEFFAQLESGRNADRFDSGVDAASGGHFHDRLHRLAIVLLIPAVAPKRFATSRRLSSRSTMMISAGE